MMLLPVFGCAAVGPNYTKPTIATPERFSSAVRSEETAAPIVDWWNALNDATLTKLVHDAVQANHEVKAAKARVREARA